MVEAQSKEIPSDIARYLTEWERRAGRYSLLHILLGFGTIVGSFTAASGVIGGWSSLCATVSGICASLLAYVDPQKKANGYASALRVVNAAVRRYLYGPLELEAVVDALNEGDQLIAQSEGSGQVSIGILRKALDEGRAVFPDASAPHAPRQITKSPESPTIPKGNND